MRSLLLILILSISFAAFSQEITNIHSYKKNNRLVVTYDLVNTQPGMTYDLKIKFTSKDGKTFLPRTISGDYRKVLRGKNKMIFWDYTKDERAIPDSLQALVEIHKSTYNPDAQKKGNAKRKKKPIIEKNKKFSNESGIYFGGTIGVAFANKYTANYYNGTGSNSLSYVLNPFNTSQYDQIKQELNGYNFTYDSTSLPQNMKYDPAFLVGFFGKYHLNSRSAICLDFNNSKFKTVDVFYLYIDSVTPFQEQPYKKCGIIGTEARFDMNLSWYQVFGSHKLFNPYFEFGFNLNNTKVKKNEIQIGSLTYSIMNYTSQMYNQEQGGIGYGFLVGAGYQLHFNQKFSFDIGFNACIKKTNIGENQQYKPNLNIFIRLVIQGFSLSFSKGSSPEDPESKEEQIENENQ
ncbi:MAG: hypothetical protein A2275_03535 [Bacteroidetes bacterium RIFOXYA12_FULL_35_11]|nr:MAG: hypothetical protein A2X01_05505 [Bacteroidetes bacterium GWF2_35_48]OFY81941.1 MAG: hypothetical protein A2275_03535 [Bacteroidetes bacterium RIFOXYA12_FULL_35_11]OFY92196.1 MAG: hypothetical protein A2309_03830 [Bacteroidetes bacterium RIFOXYB2_FULL_35_7]OFY95485.1 MAG: hypothetical protein A2491_15930 [Bacteroidetes bacterium RIFOXYC12_FULL_35_7]HBX52211.1 hypothetical protein [Bacteroidales bacterium]